MNFLTSTTMQIEFCFPLSPLPETRSKVSWIRHRDLHILTVGTYTYTTDQRFTTTHHKETDEWTLQIKFAQKRDAGLYDCQISTQPIKSYSVKLNLVGKCQIGLQQCNQTREVKDKLSSLRSVQNTNEVAFCGESIHVGLEISLWLADAAARLV